MKQRTLAVAAEAQSDFKQHRKATRRDEFLKQPSTRRGGKAGRPRQKVNDTANVHSISVQSISAASLTSGCIMLSCSSSLGRNKSPNCCCEGFGPIGLLGAICKKTATGKTSSCKSCAHHLAQLQIKSSTCGLFRTD